MVEKRFVIPVERRWTLLILPILALLYFLFVVMLAAFGFEVRAVPTEYLVLGGVALFAIVFIAMLPFLFKRKVLEAPPEAGGVAPAEPAYDPYAPIETAAPSAASLPRDDEYLLTAESAQGLLVLEYSNPAKSRNRGAVYAKTLVPVTKEHLLRLETLAAERHEI